MLKVITTFFSFTVLFFKGISAQSNISHRLSNYQFSHITHANGLSFDVTKCILKDKRGFIWIATHDGLNKFDGINFKIYRHDEHNLNSPISDKIERIAIDSKGNIWMASDRGLTKYSPCTDSFKNILWSTKSKITPVDALYIDAHDVVWFGNDDGLCSLTMAGKIEVFPIAHLLNRFSIGSILEDKEGMIWIGTQQGLYSFKKSTHIFHRFVFEKLGTEVNTINNVFLDHEDNIWVGTWGAGIGKFNKRSGTFEMYTYNNLPDIRSRSNIVLNICEQPENKEQLWVGTGEAGLAIFDKQNKTFDFATLNDNDPHAFNARTVNQVFDDHLSTLWFATNSGVVKLDKYLQQFQVNKFEPSRTAFHSWAISKVIADTFSSHSVMWIGTYGSGLVYYEPQSSKYASYIPAFGKSRGNEDVNDLIRDRAGNIWMTTEKGFYKFDIKLKSFTVCKNIPGQNSWPMNRFGNITQTGDGKLWMSVKGNGFCSFDPVTNAFKWYQKISDEKNDSINKLVFCLIKDSKENIWGGTQFGGMFRFNPTTEEFKIYNLKNGFTNQTVYSILETHDHTFWIATYNGLWNLNPQAGRFRHYTKGNGLTNNICYQLLEDDNYRLWVTTENGLSVFDPSKNIFQNYSASDGLISNVLDVSFDKGADGKFYIGFDNRYNFFNPTNIIKNNLAPPIEFTSFKIFGNEVLLPENNSAKTPLQLHYQQNMLSFEFAALNFTVSQKNQYAYKLEGADKEWVYSGARREATYSNLSGGDYIFHVKAANNDGVWNEEGKSIFIHIASPFWETWWFRIFAIAIIGGTVYFFYRRRIALIRKEEKKKTAFNKQLAQIEMKALKAQMNPHFIFNCMNSINSYILENDKKMASDYLTKFSSLIRIILENSDKQKINLADELSMLETYMQLEQNRLDNKFNYYIHVDPLIKTTAFEIPSLILQPFVENAIWHGLVHKTEKGLINIRIQKQSNRLVCTIEDNGVGRSKAASLEKKQVITHESMGMKVTEDRLKILNQLNLERPAVTIIDLLNESHQPEGTRVEIIIPI